MVMLNNQMVSMLNLLKFTMRLWSLIYKIWSISHCFLSYLQWSIYTHMKSYFNTVGVLHTRFCHGFCHVCIICYIHHWFYHIFYHGSILWFMATMGFVNRKFMPPSHARSGLKSSTCTGPLGNKIGPFYWNIMGESWDNGSPTSVFFWLRSAMV